MIHPLRLLRATRFTSLSEAASYLLLLFVAMPLKYFARLPMAVKIAGSVHGVLFVVLFLLLALSVIKRTLPPRFAAIVGLASLVPFVPFQLDRRFRNLEWSHRGTRQDQ